MPYEGPGFYRHYKGGEYEAIGLALHESELYQLVIYRPLTPGSKLEGSYDKPLPVCFWARPLSDFNENVIDPNATPDQRRKAELGVGDGRENYAIWVPRFEPILRLSDRR